MSAQWLPAWRLRELQQNMAARSATPARRFSNAAFRAQLLRRTPTDRPSPALSALVLYSMGASSAAWMHYLGESNFSTCNPDLFYRHAAEEEEVLFPALLQIAKLKNRNDVTEAVYQLMADHAAISNWMREQSVPVAMIADHALIEDGLIFEFRSELAPDMFPPATGRARVGEGLMLSSSYTAPVTQANDAARLRSLVAGAAEYYAASPAADDATKLKTLSTEYPDKAAAAEKEADQHFREYWVGTKDGAQRIAIEIGGAAALSVIAFPLAIMAVAFYGAWEVTKKFWKWVFGSGAGFSEEWVNAAKMNVTEMLSLGVVPFPFDEAFYVSPKGYAQSLAKDLNVVRYLDDYAGPGMREHFLDFTASVWRAASIDPIVRDDIGKITTDPNGWPLAYAVKTNLTTAHGALAGSRRMAEMAGLAAIHDEGAPIFIWQRVLDAAERGWNAGIDTAATMRIARKFMYDGAEYSDGDTMIDPGGGAIAAMRAYAEARKEAKIAMGTWFDKPASAAILTIFPGLTEHPDTNPPSRSGMPTPTIENPVPADPLTLARAAAKEQAPVTVKKRVGVYAAGAALGAAAWYFVSGWLAPLPIVGAWWFNKKTA